MKKEWRKPELETLDVNMTMLDTKGSHLDADEPAGTPTTDLTFS